MTDKTPADFWKKSAGAQLIRVERIARLVGICCVMCPSCIETIKARAPQATLVFDKFHIVRQLAEAVDKVRRQEVAAKEEEHKGV